MPYHERYLALREEIWQAFAQLVRTGARFPQLIDVTFKAGVNPPGLSVDSDGRSWFYATELIADPGYRLHLGEDLIVGTGEVSFRHHKGAVQVLEPDILDVYWLSQLLDAAQRPG